MNFRKHIHKLPVLMFVLSLSGIAFSYGVLSERFEIFPHAFLKEAEAGLREVVSQLRGGRTWIYRKTDHTDALPTYRPGEVQDGLSLVTSVGDNKTLSVKVISLDGDTVHQWQPDWFEIWPDATHIPSSAMPRTSPGTHIHGTELLDNGDLVFNFEHLGLVRLDVCGEVVWRLPYRTHHSIYRDEFDQLWVSGQINHQEAVARLANHQPPFIEPTILVVSLAGEILQEISVMDLLISNHLQGLLYMSTRANANTTVSGDTLHLNDVETYPSDWSAGLFEAGDIMISLRNINAVLIFDGDNHQIKHLSIGEMVRQHDPDFLDGYRYSVLDNNNRGPRSAGLQSAIRVKSLATDQLQRHYTGTDAQPFFTAIMGKHQWLANGNVLITESMKGRAFEINEAGEIVWEYINLLEDDEGYVGIVEEVQRLPGRFSRDFFEQRQAQCSAPSA